MATNSPKLPTYDIRDPQRSAAAMIEYVRTASSESAAREVHALAAQHPALRAALSERGFKEEDRAHETDQPKHSPAKESAPTAEKEREQKQADRAKPEQAQPRKAPSIAREAVTSVSRFLESEEQQQERMRPRVSEAVEKYRYEYSARKAEFDREETDRIFDAKMRGATGKELERREYLQGPTEEEIRERVQAGAKENTRKMAYERSVSVERDAKEKALHQERLARPRIQPNGVSFDEAQKGPVPENAQRRIVSHGAGVRSEALGKDYREHVETFKAQYKDQPGITMEEAGDRFRVSENGRVIHSVSDGRHPDEVHRDDMEKMRAETAKAEKALAQERAARPRIQPNGETLQKQRDEGPSTEGSQRRIVAHGSKGQSEDLGKDFKEHVETFKVQNQDRPGLTFRETDREFHVIENGRVIHSVCDDRDPEQVYRDDLAKLYAKTAQAERAAAATASASEQAPAPGQDAKDKEAETAEIFQRGSSGSEAEKAAFQARAAAYVEQNRHSEKTVGQLKSEFVAKERHQALSRAPGYKEAALSVARLRQEGRVQDAGAALEALAANTSAKELGEITERKSETAIDKEIETRIAKAQAAKEQTSAKEQASTREQTGEQHSAEKKRPGAEQEAAQGVDRSAEVQEAVADVTRDISAGMKEAIKDQNRQIEAAQRSADAANERNRESAERDARERAAEQQAAYEQWSKEQRSNQDTPSHDGPSR